MTQRIAILPETITNKIAAGEVVERPASVIKELIENSLDAGATDVTVELASGGRRLLRVTDNGHGMSREDALLSLERHATSKIRSDQDLDGIQTLGFRGEALPSIASVSRFRLATRERDSVEGTEIIVEGGKVRDVRSCGMAPGTVITVEQLFFNTPARLKFLKSAETEAGHAADAVTRMAISRPDTSFTCISDGRELLRAARSDLRRRLVQAVGKDAAANSFELDATRDGITITGLASGPGAVRSTTAAMFTYINGRFVRDRVVQHAIMQAYRGLIERGSYPVVVLFITLPPGEVDVNVHPTKHEVRFRHQSVVHDAIQDTLEHLLRTSPWLTHRQSNDKEQAVPSPAIPASQAYRERIAAAAQASLNMPAKSSRSFYTAAPTVLTVPPAVPTSVHDAEEPFQPESAVAGAEGYFSRLSVIGQFHGEYILCQSADELVIIDQHAASERVAFQRLRAQYRVDGIESQRLLFPETLELSFSEIAVARRFQHDLAAIGFELEPFGGTTLLVSAVPRLVSEKQAGLLVRDLLGELSQLGASSAFQEAMDELLARIACHSVVRGFHPLDSRQIRELLLGMDQTDFAATCPHGRPVSHVITLSAVEKLFKRT